MNVERTVAVSSGATAVGGPVSPGRSTRLEHARARVYQARGVGQPLLISQKPATPVDVTAKSQLTTLRIKNPTNVPSGKKHPSQHLNIAK
jgi:hypothetical protein